MISAEMNRKLTEIGAVIGSRSHWSMNSTDRALSARSLCWGKSWSPFATKTAPMG